MIEFKNWINENFGIYRYYINEFLFYEIIIECHYKCTPVETAKASLYKVIIHNKGLDNEYIERICKKQSLPIQELLNFFNEIFEFN